MVVDLSQRYRDLPGKGDRSSVRPHNAVLTHSFIITKHLSFSLWCRWLALLPHTTKILGSNPVWGLSMRSLHILPMTGYSVFLPQSKDKPGIKLIYIACRSEWLSVSTRLSTYDSQDRFEPSCNTKLDKKMGGWIWSWGPYLRNITLFLHSPPHF